MAITTPEQIRSLDPYADHRFSNSINRFNRIFSRGQDMILPFDNYEFPLTLQTIDGTETINSVVYNWYANRAIKIGAGVCIKDDVLIHCKNSAYLVFTDPTNYVGTSAGYNLMDATGKYFILIKYVYSRSIPAPELTYVIAKQRSEFLLNREKYIYLGTANVTLSGANYIISSISDGDSDELNGYAVIERPKYEFTLTEVDGGDIG